MEITEWWPRVDSGGQAWLIAHNGEAVIPVVLKKIVDAGGSVSSDASWVGEATRDGFYLSDEAVDWIETIANDEND